MRFFSKITLCSLVLFIAMGTTNVSAAYQNKYDLNNDGRNDVTDITLFSLYLLGETEPSNLSKYDFDNNKIVSYRDYVEIYNAISYSTI